MQRIIDNASANVDDDVYPIVPFSRANTLQPSQSTFSRHFNNGNGSSLQDVFSFRPPQQQIPRPPQYVDSFGKLFECSKAYSRSNLVVAQIGKAHNMIPRINMALELHESRSHPEVYWLLMGLPLRAIIPSIAMVLRMESIELQTELQHLQIFAHSLQV